MNGDNTGPIHSLPASVRIRVHAQPGAKSTELAGLHDGALKVRVQAPPLEGRANEELIRFLAERLGVARSQITLIRGAKSRSKIFEVSGISETLVRVGLKLEIS